MLRPFYILLLIAGLAATAYAAWSWHRISNEVLMDDRNWPRPAPYPDGWLLALNDWFDARYPVTNVIKLHGEIERVRSTVLAALFVSASVALCGGVPLAIPWLRRLRRSRGFEVIASSAQTKKMVRGSDPTKPRTRGFEVVERAAEVEKDGP